MVDPRTLNTEAIARLVSMAKEGRKNKTPNSIITAETEAVRGQCLKEESLSLVSC